MLVPKKKLIVPESAYGVCLWEIDGKFLCNDEGALSLEGRIGDREVEEKMRKAVIYWVGEEIGKPTWIAGARKVTDEEYEEQSERLKEGLIPDPVDEARQTAQKLNRGE